MGTGRDCSPGSLAVAGTEMGQRQYLLCVNLFISSFYTVVN